MNPSEPTPADIAAVAASLGQPAPAPEPTPAPAPQPQLQPEAPTPQPAPTQQPQDPFASLFASEPAPTEPTAQPQPTQPTEPTTPQPQGTPTEPTQPTPSQPTEPVAQQPQQQIYTDPETGKQYYVQPVQTTPVEANPADDYQTYEDYMKQTLAGVPQTPKMPDAESIDPNDPAAIKGFFDELVNTAVTRAEAATARKEAIRVAEKSAWDGAFGKYPSLQSNKELRDMVHNIRMGYFNRGVAITPTQAAEKLLASLGAQYNKGIADNQVQTTIESVQPQGGGATQVPTTLDRQNVLTAVQDGGETALAAFLDGEVKAGRL